MQFILIIICSIILPGFSLKESLPSKHNCNNCKFFVPNRLTENTEYGKCSLFPIVKNNLESLINGLEKIDYIYCTTVRKYSDMCGKKAKMYKPKIMENEKNNTKMENEENNTKIEYEENEDLKKESDNLKKESDNLKKENEDLKKENEELKRENEWGS